MFFLSFLWFFSRNALRCCSFFFPLLPPPVVTVAVSIRSSSLGASHHPRAVSPGLLSARRNKRWPPRCPRPSHPPPSASPRASPARAAPPPRAPADAPLPSPFALPAPSRSSRARVICQLSSSPPRMDAPPPPTCSAAGEGGAYRCTLAPTAFDVCRHPPFVHPIHRLKSSRVIPRRQRWVP